MIKNISMNYSSETEVHNQKIEPNENKNVKDTITRNQTFVFHIHFPSFTFYSEFITLLVFLVSLDLGPGWSLDTFDIRKNRNCRFGFTPHYIFLSRVTTPVSPLSPQSPLILDSNKGCSHIPFLDKEL